MLLETVNSETQDIMQVIPPGVLARNGVIENGLSDATFFSWRMYTFKKARFTKMAIKDMEKNLEKVNEDEYKYTNENIFVTTSDINYSWLSSSMSKLNIHFVLFDSCVVCNYDIALIFHQMQCTLGTDGTLIMINNDLSISENISKLQKRKFKQIHQRIRKNLKFMSRNEEKENVHSVFLHKGLVHDILTNAESSYLKVTKDRWYPAHSRQEVNDNAQLLLMDYIAELHDCNSIVVTFDKGVIKKVEDHYPRLMHYKP